MQERQGASGTSDVIAEVAAGVLLAVAMVCGGGSRGMGDLVVHLTAFPALVLGILRWRHATASRLQRAFLYWLIAAFVLVVLQLLPLPASWFARLPQRAAVLADLRAAGLAPVWLPMTLDIWGTVRAVLALATFAAMWLLASALAPAARLRLLKLAVLVAVPMALLGFAQAAAGHQPTLRFYAFHNEFGATATFANRNHLASLLAMLLPLAFLFGREAQRMRRQGWMLGWYGCAVVLLLAAALTFSRAGTVLATLAAGAGLLLALLVNRDDLASRRRVSVPLLAASAVAFIAIANYAWIGIADRFDRDPLGDLRWQYVRHGLEAVTAYLPWGSGLGSFSAAYAQFEPVTAMVSSYALHAHNDLIEVAIEAGFPGLLLTATLLAMLVAALRKIPLVSRSSRATLATAALAAAVPLAHSLVDYPLRTLAVTVLFALLLAQLRATPAAGSISEHGKQDAIPG